MDELQTFSKQLDRLTKDLASLLKEKVETKRVALVQKAEAEAAAIVWTRLLEILAAERERSSKQVDEWLQSRREQLQQLARERGHFARRLGNEDQFGVLRVRYQGPTVIIRFAGVSIADIEDTDAAAVLDRVVAAEKTLRDQPFDRVEFFRALRAVLTTPAAREQSRTGELPVRMVHHEMVFEMARRSERFRKNPSPRNLPDYSLAQFLFDLARFADGGWREGEDAIRARTPSMSESRDAFLLPSLSHPDAHETPVTVLNVERQRE